MAVNQIFTTTLSEANSSAATDVTNVPVGAMRQLLPNMGTEVSPEDIASIFDIIRSQNLEFTQYADPSVSTIRSLVREAVGEALDIPYDVTDFADAIFAADLLVEMSPPRKKSLDAALGAVMASSFASGGVLMAAMIHDAHVSGPLVLVIGPVGMLTIGAGGGGLFLRLRKAVLDQS